ncbi:secreted protein C isoform X1 [Capsicum galapagoense]
MNYGKSGNSFDFDLGLNSGRSGSRTPLNDQKNKTSSYTYSSTQSKPNSGSSWTQPNKSTWTHQPIGSLSGPTSMAGDIFGKSWGSSAPSTTTNVASSVGIANKNPNLFGDLVSSALGGNKSNNNAPLKNAAPTANNTAFSMGAMADNLSKSGNSGVSWGSAANSGTGNAGGYNAYNYSGSVNLSGGNSKTPNLGGTSLKNMAGSGVGGGMGVNKDPFGSLVDFSSKPVHNIKSGTKETKKSSSEDDMFGDFQNANKSGGSGFPSDPFPTSNINASTGSNPGGAYSKVDDFGFTNTQSQPSATQSSGVGDFDSLFSSTTALSGGAAGGSANQHFTGGDDWGFESEFVGANDSSGTTEIEGLPPPPPSGVSGSAAKNRGMDNHKQGQYADAIKWLSWAVILLEKAGDDASVIEVLSSRASCYKEIGEYKKAVADCTKVLEQDGTNVSVLVQRALLYESMEKYKLGAEDLRTVMKIDPANRVARSTVHRLTKMAG